MGALFGKHKNKSRVTQEDKAVLQLKVQRDKLKQYQRRIQNNLEKDSELIRKLLRDGKKDRARLMLRKKKYQEHLLATADGQLENLEKLTHDLEFAQIEVQVIDGLRVGNEALKKVNAMLDINEIERIMDETREGVEKQKEIDEMLSGALSEEDEESVLAELDSLIKEQTVAEPSTSPEVIDETGEATGPLDLPEVPTDEPEEGNMKRKRAKASKEKVAVEA